MFEKVNPSHPDKMADRLAGAVVDMAYAQQENPKIAVEVLAGHGLVTVMIETSLSEEQLNRAAIDDAIMRIFDIKDVAEKPIMTMVKIVQQDARLAANQRGRMRCGDNGIFRGCPVTKEQADLTSLVGEMYECFPTDGKYLTAPMTLANGERCEQSLIVCQSHGTEYEIDRCIHGWELLKFGDYMDLYPYEACVINPLGPWTGGIDVDCGCTNRKLGSDMGDGVTGGGLHGKDLSKADVSVNIACHQMAQLYHQPVEASCAIGDTLIEFMRIDGSRVAVPYEQVVRDARDYINSLGGFEKFAEWGLIRP